jgi:membrane protein
MEKPRDLLKETYRSFLVFLNKCQEDELLTRAAALAFVFIIGLLPLILLLLGLASAIAYIKVPMFELRVEDILSSYLTPNFSEQVRSLLAKLSVQIRHGNLGIFSAMGILFTTYSMTEQMDTTINRIWGIDRNRTFRRRLAIYAFFFIAAPLLLSLSITMTTGALAWARSLGSGVSIVAIFISTFSPLAFSGALFYLLHTILPARKVSSLTGFKVAFVSAFVFELCKQSFTFYAANIVGRSFYGSMATIPLFFAWTYISWVVILVGAEACYFLEIQRPEQ